MWLPKFIRDSLSSRIRLRVNAGVELRDQGDLTGSQETLERASEICAKWLGKEHQDTLAALSQLARTYRDLGDFERSIAMHQQVLLARSASGDWQAVDSRVALADSLILSGRKTDGYDFIKRAMSECGVEMVANAALREGAAAAACEVVTLLNPHMQSSPGEAAAMEWLKAITDDYGNSTIRLAETLLQNGRRDEAHLLLNHAIAGRRNRYLVSAALRESKGPAACALVGILEPTFSPLYRHTAMRWLRLHTATNRRDDLYDGGTLTIRPSPPVVLRPPGYGRGRW